MDSIFLRFCCCCSDSGFVVLEMERTQISQFILDKKIKENKLQNNESFKWTYLPFRLSLLCFRELYWQQYGTLVLVSRSNQHALFTNYFVSLFQLVLQIFQRQKNGCSSFQVTLTQPRQAGRIAWKIKSKIAYFIKDKRIPCGLTV